MRKPRQSLGTSAWRRCGSAGGLPGRGWRLRPRRAAGISLVYVRYVSYVSYICAGQDVIDVRYLARMPDDAINPYADEPLYVQLAGIVRRMIETGRLKHLDPVPSESSLVQAYGVSRVTARRAIALLRDEGAVFTVAQRGTYVGPRPE